MCEFIISVFVEQGAPSYSLYILTLMIYRVLQLTSGYVFCYLCIVAHIQQAGKCPVTFAPTTVSDLIRIYEEDSAM